MPIVRRVSWLSLNSTEPFKVLRIGPCDSALDEKPGEDYFTYLESPTGLRGVNAKRCVSVIGASHA